jgi:hypothetical protein
MEDNLRGHLNYTEIYRKRNKVKPKYLWCIPFGKFIHQKRDFRDKVMLDFGCDVESDAYKQWKNQNKREAHGYYGFDSSLSPLRWLRENNLYYDFWTDNSIKFDVINASQVYEHLTEDMREKFIVRSGALLKEGGILYLDFPYIQNLGLIDFFQDRTHRPVSCVDEALYIEQLGFAVNLYVGGYTMPYATFFSPRNIVRIFANLLLGYKPFFVTFIVANKGDVQV